jgi:hypothetical protein
MPDDLSMPLQFLARILKQDGARSLGRAVMFAIDADLDKVERYRSSIAAGAGITEVRLQEIISTARSVLSAGPATVHEQHVVSQVLLRRFVRETPTATGVSTYSLQRGLLKGPRSTRNIGKLTDFVRIDGDTTEELWQETESKMREALDAARTSALFKYPEHVQTLKDAVALHFARSLEVLEAHRRLWEEGVEAMVDNWKNNGVGLESLFYSRYGLFPPSGAVAREIMATDLVAKTRRLYENGTIFRLRVVDLFESVREASRNSGLQIIRPASGEFLIGDSPAFTIDAKRKRVGVLGGSAFLDATTVVLPLGPRRLAALSHKDEWVDAPVPRAFVDQLNMLQAQKAQKQIYFRPGAHFVRFLNKHRPPTHSPLRR